MLKKFHYKNNSYDDEYNNITTGISNTANIYDEENDMKRKDKIDSEIIENKINKDKEINLNNKTNKYINKRANIDTKKDTTNNKNNLYSENEYTENRSNSSNSNIRNILIKTNNLSDTIHYNSNNKEKTSSNFNLNLKKNKNDTDLKFDSNKESKNKEEKPIISKLIENNKNYENKGNNSDNNNKYENKEKSNNKRNSQSVNISNKTKLELDRSDNSTSLFDYAIKLDKIKEEELESNNKVLLSSNNSRNVVKNSSSNIIKNSRDNYGEDDLGIDFNDRYNNTNVKISSITEKNREYYEFKYDKENDILNNKLSNSSVNRKMKTNDSIFMNHTTSNYNYDSNTSNTPHNFTYKNTDKFKGKNLTGSPKNDIKIKEKNNEFDNNNHMIDISDAKSKKEFNYNKNIYDDNSKNTHNRNLNSYNIKEKDDRDGNSKNSINNTAKNDIPNRNKNNISKIRKYSNNDYNNDSSTKLMSEQRSNSNKEEKKGNLKKLKTSSNNLENTTNKNIIYNNQEEQYIKMLENERQQYILYEKIFTISFSLVIIGCIIVLLLGLVFMTYMNTNKDNSSSYNNSYYQY